MNKVGFILVVEDDEKNRKLFCDLLKAKGYDVIEAENGKRGVELAREKNPVLILLDWQMPVMDGREAIKVLKSDPATIAIPVLVISASAMMEEITEIEESGCDGYIMKPINIAEFINKIKEFVPAGDTSV